MSARSRVAAMLVATALAAHAATVRGRVQRNVPNRPPAGGLQVTLRTPQGRRSFSVTTDANGMYFMPNVAPGPYVLEIWNRPGGTPISVPITVSGQLQDVPPIVIP